MNNKMKTKVSVLVTFYNQEKYVDRAIKSIIEQNAKFGINILVGDDGSSDHTRELVKKWISFYPNSIKLYVMERNSDNYVPGFRASRNRLNLLRYVDTDYFIFLDGDDYFDSRDKLQKQVDILDNPFNNDCIACAHNVDMLFPDGRRFPITSTKLKEGKYSPTEYWNKLYFHPDSLLIRSSVISSLDFNLLKNNFNDNVITFSFIQYGNIYYIPLSWAVYYQTGYGIWTEGNRIVNNIRNMFVFDLCNKINSQMIKETSKRFSSAWFYLFLLRNKLNPDELELYYQEAKRIDLFNSCSWIEYKYLPFYAKNKLLIKAFHLSWKYILKKIASKFYHLIRCSR